MELKIATPQDVPEIAEFLLDFYEESVYSDLYELNIDKAMKTIEGWTVGESSDVLWIKGVGAISISLTQNWFSDEVLAVENFWYVHPDYRGTQAGTLLLRCAEEWAKGMGSYKLHMSTNKNTHLSVANFLLTDGYEEAETSVVKEL